MHVLTEMMGYGYPRRQKLQFPSLLHARDIAVHGPVRFWQSRVRLALSPTIVSVAQQSATHTHTSTY